MIPLRVTAKMLEPIVYYNDGMHLDGILAYGKYLDLTNKEKRQLPMIGEAWAVDLDLPLEKWFVESEIPLRCDDRLFSGNVEIAHDGMKRGSIWGWKASGVIADWICEDSFPVRRRPEIDQMIRYTNSPSVNIGAGQQKATNLILPVRFAAELYWYAVGDQEAVISLLGGVSSIGKLTTKGAGKVAEWIVEAVEDDYSIEKDGELLRNMPISYLANGFYAECSIRAPYHHFSRIIPGLRPKLAGLSNAYM